jgi:protein phosphatase
MLAKGRTLWGRAAGARKPLDHSDALHKSAADACLALRSHHLPLKGATRIIYGLEYTLAENLHRLKSLGLGAKRSLALREFALGLEALERFVHRKPLRRVHECVFGVLALESEPVDPRL